MDFLFTSEQEAIADLASQLFEFHTTDECIKKLADQKSTFDADLWGQLSKTGLIALGLSTDHGGSGQGMLELGLVLEKQGQYLASAPLWQHIIASLAVEQFAPSSLREQLLTDLARGDQVVAMACDVDACESLVATNDGHLWKLSGKLHTIAIEKEHTHLLLLADSIKGRCCFLVPLHSKRLTRVDGFLTDHQPISDLTFDHVSVSHDHQINLDIEQWLEPRIHLCISFLQLGVIHESLKRTAAFSAERHQFGKPIGSFQSLAVKAADAYIEVELLRSCAWQLAWRLDHQLPSVAAGRVAKFHAAKAGHIVGHTVQHIHGGIGTDLTYPIHHFFLKSQTLALMGGGQENMLSRIGQSLAHSEFESYIHE